MTKSAWQRTGAFVGTVVTVAMVAKTSRRNSSADMIGAIGKSFSNSLGAAMGQDMSVAQYQKGGTGSVNIQSAGNINVLSAADVRVIRYGHRSLLHILWSLFPQVMMPYEIDWHRWVEVIYGEDWKDASRDWAGITYFGELIGELRESYESR